MRHFLFASFLVVMALNGTHRASATLVAYEGFDIPLGPLHNQAGATSFGFDPAFGQVWDKGVYDDPEVRLGSIASPLSVSNFYIAVPIGNRAAEDYQSTVATRTLDAAGSHFYGTFLANMNLDGFYSTRATVHFTNFSVFAENPGSGSTQASWKVQTPAGITDTGVNAQGATLVSWELEFDQLNSLNPDTLRIWLNTNPLSDPADFSDSAADLGQNLLGGIGLYNSIFLGLSTAAFDELRVGTDWQSVGVIPEPDALALAVLASAALAAVISRRTRKIARGLPARNRPSRRLGSSCEPAGLRSCNGSSLTAISRHQSRTTSRSYAHVESPSNGVPHGLGARGILFLHSQ